MRVEIRRPDEFAGNAAMYWPLTARLATQTWPSNFSIDMRGVSSSPAASVDNARRNCPSGPSDDSTAS